MINKIIVPVNEIKAIGFIKSSDNPEEIVKADNKRSKKPNKDEEKDFVKKNSVGRAKSQRSKNGRNKN